MSPPDTETAAPLDTVVYDADVPLSPSAVLCCTSTIPVETVVKPLYVFAPAKVKVLAAVFFVSSPVPLIIPVNF